MNCPPIKWHETPKWSVILADPVGTFLPIKGQHRIFRSGDVILGELFEDGWLEIRAGYACDGYSPTFRLFGKWIRLTPTPSRAGMFPAVLHDFTRQFCETPGSAWTRENSDIWFYDALIAGGESKKIAGTYYAAVSRAIGDFYYSLRKHDPKLSIELP